MNTNTQPVIKAEYRTLSSKSANRKLRSNGFVLGNLYSKGTATPIAITASTLPKCHTRANVTHLELQDTVKTVLMREVQVNPLTDAPIHFDFHEVSATDKVQVNIPLDFIGLTREQEKEGTLGILVRYLNIEGVLSKLPSSIQVDVSSLKAGNSVRLFDLNLPKDLRVKTGKGQNVALASLVSSSVS